MNEPRRNPGSERRRLLLAVPCLCAAAAVFTFLVLRRAEGPRAIAGGHPAGGKESSVSAVAQSAEAAPNPAAGPRPREFSVAVQNGSHAWAAADFKATNFIRQLAHNGLEYRRMLDENARIFRRQLVYWEETPNLVWQRARAAGAPVTQLTLPALDGRQLQFKITGSDVHPSGLEGMFRGHLVGQPESFVTLAFYQGRQAFTVLSLADNLFLDAEAHEPGEVVIKEVSPALYFAGVCGVK